MVVVVVMMMGMRLRLRMEEVAVVAGVDERSGGGSCRARRWETNKGRRLGLRDVCVCSH